MERDTVEIGMPIEEFIRLYDAEGPFELINGERVPKMPNVAGHGEIIEILYLAIYSVVSAGQLGKVLREMPFVLSYSSNWVTGSRVPDLMYYIADRINAYKAATPDWKDKPYVLVPDLVVEVVSPNDDLGVLDEKIDLYLSDGVRAVWTVDPQRGKVAVYVLVLDKPQTKQQTTLTRNDTLTGGEIIPGFEIKVSTIFGE
jgi:Uma2 family endonuclease